MLASSILINLQRVYSQVIGPKIILCGLYIMSLLILTNCGVHDYDDRAGAIANNIRVDSVLFVQPNTRYILADSTTQIRLKGIHLGYVCSEILKLELDSSFDLNALILKPNSQIRLPAQPTCAIDTSRNRDSVFNFVFRDGKKPISVVLRNSLDSITALALILRGKVFSDSIDTVLSPTHSSLTIKSGKDSVFFQDTLGIIKRYLVLKSVSTCVFLTQATITKKDSVSTKVKYSWILQDSTVAQDTCHHTDSILVSSALK